MFRISALVLTASALCLCFSARADDAEDKALALVKKHGERVTRDEHAPEKPIITVDLFGTEITGAELKELATLQ